MNKRSMRTFKNMISTKKEMSIWNSKRNKPVLLKNHFQGSGGIEITTSGPLVICPGFTASLLLLTWMVIGYFFFLPFPWIFSLLQTVD
jgi:hypothetical protein